MKKKVVIIADNLIEWFKFLKNGGCIKLRVYFQISKDQTLAKDYKLTGLVGEGRTWLLETVYDSYSNGWSNRWESCRTILFV
ncbi:MAG TPA: hypothetical protein VGO09_06450, partial [Flavisolibacter sp.]|nr:hypothetical protein [Flavisolibacter sp.]